MRPQGRSGGIALPGLTFLCWNPASYQCQDKEAKKEAQMEPIVLSLCTECEHCPQIGIHADKVEIGEAGNAVRLTHAEWNRLVELVRGGQVGPVK